MKKTATALLFAAALTIMGHPVAAHATYPGKGSVAHLSVNQTTHAFRPSGRTDHVTLMARSKRQLVSAAWKVRQQGVLMDLQVWTAVKPVRVARYTWFGIGITRTDQSGMVRPGRYHVTAVLVAVNGDTYRVSRHVNVRDAR